MLHRKHHLGSPPHQPPSFSTPSPAGSFGTLGASGSSQLPPPPPPPSTNQSDQSTSTAAPSSSKTAASAEYTAWTTTDIRLKPSVSLIPEEIHIDDDTTPDKQVQSFGDEDIGHDHIPTVNLRPALSISKMKAAYYPDVGLEQMVPDQMWIEEECKTHILGCIVSCTDSSHMRILNVSALESFSLYGYDYMKKIVLRRADLKEHIIAERDFKYLYPSDFEDLWDATGFEFKHDFTVIDSPRAVTFRDKYKVQMIMRFNKIHKFSDGTLQQIDEALDYRVKEFKVNRMNPETAQTRREYSKTLKALLEKDKRGDYILQREPEMITSLAIKSIHGGSLSTVHSELDDIEKVGSLLPAPTTKTKSAHMSSLKMGDTTRSHEYRITTPWLHEHMLLIKDIIEQIKDYNTALRNSDVYYHDPKKYEHAGPMVTTSQEGNTP
ncbi:hypothetical protein Tco_0448579 [Tanacetum coccineum]